MITRLTTLALALSGLALAQPALALDVPVSLEGAIENINTASDTITVMGIEVSVPRDTPITTPTADINQLAADMGAAIGRPGTKPLVLMRRWRVGGVDILPATLPGRSQLGFLGGTAQIEGTAVLDDVTGALVSVTATSVFAEPAENVIVGGITSVNCSTPLCDGAGDVLTNLGRPLVRLTDPRMPAVPVQDEFGFGIDISLVAGPIPSAVEGYYGSDQNFYYHTLSLDVGTTGAALLNQGPEVAMTLADCRDRGGLLEVEIRGATHDPASGTVSFQDPANGFVLGSVAVTTVLDEVTGQPTRYGDFRFRADVRDPAGLGCPAIVRATFINGGGVTAETAMSIR